MFENSSDNVDIYCERLSTGFWAEPLNAVTNLGFILAGLLIISLVHRQAPRAWDITALAMMAIIVGIGSFLFHTVATKGAMLADIFPIIIFIHFAIGVIFVRVFNIKWYYAVATVVAFAVFNALVMNIFGRQLFNGSIQYVPTLLFLLAVAAYSYSRRLLVMREFLIAALVFLVSITCRSIDMMVCDMLPLGTHFLWHILNAVTMYYVMKGLLKAASAKPAL
jgi:hypothetical protein